MSEREFAPSTALSKIQNIIKSLNLFSVTNYTDSDKLVATADLFDSQNNLIQSGAGKGPDSLVGALAESIEHLCLLMPATSDVSTQSCEFVASQKAAQRDGFLTSLSCLSNSIQSLKLTTVDNTAELFVPTTLLCPRVTNNSVGSACPATQFLSRYSSNSGTAFGCTKAEALLHGTHEVIERHVLSRFFMAVCSIGPAVTMYTPSKILLATALRENSYALSRANKLQVIVIKDFMNVYFSVALPKVGPGPFHLSPIGSGCSLDICIAIQRAVTEQFQVEDLYDIPQEATDKKTLDFLAGADTLRPLIDFFPVKNLTLPILDIPKMDLASSVPEQLEALQNNIEKSGKTIFYRVLAQYSEDGTVCQTYVPGLERFNLIRNGYFVAPQRVLRQDNNRATHANAHHNGL